MKTKKRVCSNPNPMVDNDLISCSVAARGMTLYEFADVMGMCYPTLRSRLDDGRWTVLEAWRVCKALDLDFDTVFLAHPEKVMTEVFR